MAVDGGAEAGDGIVRLLMGGVVMGLSVSAPIGPVNVEMIQRGLRGGFRSALLVGIGATFADLIYISVAYAGADPLSHRVWARVLLFGAGSLILIYLGIAAIRAARVPIALDDAAGPRRFGAGHGPFSGGFLITLLNPMTIAFWLGILSASLAARPREALAVELMYVASLAAGCLLWVLVLSVALHYGKRFVRGRALQVVSIVAGLVLIGFGLDFALKAGAS